MKIDTQVGSPKQQTLAEVRARHAKRLKKVERARAKLERASRKLHALEAELARMDSAQQDGNPRTAQLIFNPGSKSVLDGTYSLERVVECLRAHNIASEVGI